VEISGKGKPNNASFTLFDVHPRSPPAPQSGFRRERPIDIFRRHVNMHGMDDRFHPSLSVVLTDCSVGISTIIKPTYSIDVPRE
jgi:hypothetical protein